jgi:hypothetical protein
MRPGFVGSYGLGPGRPAMRADTRENPVGKNGVMTPHLFSWPNGLDGTIGGKSVPERSFVHPKKHVFGWNFLMKPVPYLFSGPNWLYGGFGGKIVPDENFAQFFLKSPLEFVFPKNMFSV